MQIASMTAQEAKDLLRHCLEDGVVMRSDHFVQELANESFTDLDIETACGMETSGSRQSRI